MSTHDVESAVNHLINYCMKTPDVKVKQPPCYNTSVLFGKCVKDIGLTKKSDIVKIKSKLIMFYIEQKSKINNKQVKNNQVQFINKFGVSDAVSDEAIIAKFIEQAAKKFKEGFTITNTKLRMLCYCLLYEYSKMKYSNDTRLGELPSVMPYIIEQFDDGGKLIADYKIGNSSEIQKLVSDIIIVYNIVNKFIEIDKYIPIYKAILIIYKAILLTNDVNSLTNDVNSFKERVNSLTDYVNIIKKIPYENIILSNGYNHTYVYSFTIYPTAPIYLLLLINKNKLHPEDTKILNNINEKVVRINENVDEINENVDEIKKKTYIEIIKYFIETGKLSNIAHNDNTVLTYALRYRDIDMFNALLEDVVKINEIDSNNNTALMISVKYHDYEAVTLLLEKGADPNIKDNDGKTALMYTAMNHYFNRVKLLLEKGADPNIKDNDGKTALMYTVSYVQNLDGVKLDIVKILLKKGADPNIKDNDGKTALYYAEMVYREPTAEYDEILELLKIKPQINAGSNRKRRKKITRKKKIATRRSRKTKIP